jgi:hypothetical protein
MGAINAENTLKFRSSDSLFDRIKKRLNSFDSSGLIDDGDFHKHIKYVLEEIGQAVYKECEAVLPVKDFKTRLPGNFKNFHAAYRCSFEWSGTKSINEQRPWIYYFDTEITRDCPKECTIECKPEYGKTKVVIRTFVNGEPCNTGTCHSPVLLTLSPNVRELCAEDCLNQFSTNQGEIGVKDGHIITNFDSDSIYIQYYGLPIDENGLPMIPDNENVEKAIEYYIYTQLFEEWYWNSTVPDMPRMLADARQQFDFYIAMARYWGRLPSFQKQIQSIRRQRSNRKFFYSRFDKTMVSRG